MATMRDWRVVETFQEPVSDRRHMDTFGRTVDYLRISVTDRCNERCLHCLPEGYQGWERQPDPLTADEILRVVRVAVSIGFRKFRLTGGEPERWSVSSAR